MIRTNFECPLPRDGILKRSVRATALSELLASPSGSAAEISKQLDATIQRYSDRSRPRLNGCVGVGPHPGLNPCHEMGAQFDWIGRCVMGSGYNVI